MEDDVELKKEWVLFGYALKNIKGDLVCLENQFNILCKPRKTHNEGIALLRAIKEFDNYRSDMDDELAKLNLFKDDVEFKEVFYGDSTKLLHKYCKEI